MMTIPIIYIHFGPLPAYLWLSIEKTLENNSHAVLLTDQVVEVPGVEIVDLKAHLQGVDTLRNAYVHMSTNKEYFEFICLARWFIIRNYASAKGIKALYYNDSDVFNFCNVSEIYERYAEFDACYLDTVGRDGASGCCSFWKTDTLVEFCNFVMSSYSSPGIDLLRNKWTEIRDKSVREGVSDMSFLFMFIKQINFGSLTQVRGGACFDMNPLISQNHFEDEYKTERVFDYRTRAHVKKLVFDGGVPMAFNKRTGNQVRIYAGPEYAKLEIRRRELPMAKRLYNRLRQMAVSRFGIAS